MPAFVSRRAAGKLLTLSLAVLTVLAATAAWPAAEAQVAQRQQRAQRSEAARALPANPAANPPAANPPAANAQAGSARAPEQQAAAAIFPTGGAGLCQCISDRTRRNMHCLGGPAACQSVCGTTNYSLVPDAAFTCPLAPGEQVSQEQQPGARPLTPGALTQ